MNKNKEMTIVWHDLIEDPNDLPHIDDNKIWSEEVFVQTTYGQQFCAAYRKPTDEEEGIWYNKINMIELKKETIEAWAYVSKYHNREKQINRLLMKLPFMVFHRIEVKE